MVADQTSFEDNGLISSGTHDLPPLEVNDADDVLWDESSDIVIVGFGGAGVVAALEARENGASVIALDRFAGGGATQLSQGVMYAGGTQYQEDIGVADSPQAMFDYLTAEDNALSPATLKRFCETSADNMAWTERHGSMRGSHLGKKPLIYYSGNEQFMGDVAAPAPRGHKMKTKKIENGGNAYYWPLHNRALGLGTRFIPHAPVRRLVIDRHGTVIGVQASRLPPERTAKHAAMARSITPHRPFLQRKYATIMRRARQFEDQFGQPILIRATRGVILTTGGFTFEPAMIRSHRPDVHANYDNILKFGSLGCDGSGIRLAQSVGAGADYMDQILLCRLVNPPSLQNGILIDHQARRWINETAYPCDIGDALSQLPGGTAWLIVSGKDFWSAVRQGLTNLPDFKTFGLPALINMIFGGTKRARSVDDLARKISVDSEQLRQTISDYNKSANSGRADPMGKLQHCVQPLKAPYYAINWSFRNPLSYLITFMFTLGGVRVNEESGAVVRPDGSDIAGLYAAGRTAVGLCSKGYDAGGLSISDTLFSGRRAGRTLAAEPGAVSSLVHGEPQQ